MIFASVEKGVNERWKKDEKGNAEEGQRLDKLENWAFQFSWVKEYVNMEGRFDENFEI